MNVQCEINVTAVPLESVALGVLMGGQMGFDEWSHTEPNTV